MTKKRLHEALKLLFSPQEFYKKKWGWNGAMAIVSVFGFISGLSVGLLNFVTLTAMGASKLAIFTGSIFPATITFLEAFFIWFLNSCLFFTISHFLHGKGEFKILLSNVGYGFLPMIISSIIGLFIGIAVWGKLSTVIELGVALRNPYTTLSNIQSLLFLLWSANIWIFGVSSARHITAKRAAITVIIPVGAIIGYEVYWLFWLGVFQVRPIISNVFGFFDPIGFEIILLLISIITIGFWLYYELFPHLIIKGYGAKKIDCSNILSLFKESGIKVKGVYLIPPIVTKVLRLSKKSIFKREKVVTRSMNAYAMGLSRKYIFVTEDAISGLGEKELEGILAHEVGHHIHKHLVKGYVTTVIWVFSIYLLVLLTRNYPTSIKWLIFWLPLPYYIITAKMWRRFERQADAYVKEKGYGPHLATALQKMAEYNKIPMDSGIILKLFGFHPSIASRIKALTDKEVDGK